jgi:phospholipase C
MRVTGSRLRRRRLTRWGALVGAAALAMGAGTSTAWGSQAGSEHRGGPVHTTTPIKHLVVIYGENVSFDHYFGTYPNAANSDGTKFTPAKNTPKANTEQNAGLIASNPNLYTPKRLTPSEALTCDQNHSYSPEQRAADGGKEDKYVQNTSVDKCSAPLFSDPGLAMDYYDGNAVTALWNYAQQYTLNDNSFSDTYGPSTPGALNLISGQTHGGVSTVGTSSTENPVQTSTPDQSVTLSQNAAGVGTVVRDTDPAYDDCSDNNHTTTGDLLAMKGKNIGDLLNSKGVTWGWFQGGFRPTTAYAGPGSHAVCGATHTNVGGATDNDYSPHHEPFQYYKSTANPHHLPPSSVRAIGSTDQANHQYDITDFDSALSAGNLPAVSFLKAGEYQDGHAGYSDPLDEQHFLVKEINALQKSPEWSSTAVVLAYDDSDGWYDHVYHAPTNGSDNTALDSSGQAIDTPACTAKQKKLGGYQDRCGPGMRQPLLVISPYAKTNHVDHTFTQQSSILRFVEDNWRTGRIGDGSFDATAGSLQNAFNFNCPNGKRVLLNSDGSVASVSRITPPHDTLPDSSDAALQLGAATSSGDSSALLAGGLGAAVIAAAGTGLFMARRQRGRA